MITPKSFRLEWKPLYNTISLDLRVYYGYRIQYTVSRTTEWVTYDVPFNRSHFVMTDLQDNSTYDCKIVPFRNTTNGFDTGISLNATLSTLGCPRKNNCSFTFPAKCLPTYETYFVNKNHACK